MAVITDRGELKRHTAWLGSVNSRDEDVSALVPEVFEAYARIFHPAWRECDEHDLPVRGPTESRTGAPIRAGDGDVLWREVTWREIAEANGKTAHAGMQWPSITLDATSQPGLWDRAPLQDSLPLRQTLLLSDVLRNHTAMPESCLVGVWEGYADVAGLYGDPELPVLTWAGRRMIVAAGTQRDVTARALDALSGPAPYRYGPEPPGEDYRSPTLWWPEDRSWCVATDIEMDSTYVGGSTGCIADLLALTSLEAHGVTSKQPITWDSDLLNEGS